VKGEGNGIGVLKYESVKIKRGMKVIDFILKVLVSKLCWYHHQSDFCVFSKFLHDNSPFIQPRPCLSESFIFMNHPLLPYSETFKL